MTDEDAFQAAIPAARTVLAELRRAYGCDAPAVIDLATRIAHCEWRRDNQDHPHPHKDART